MYGGTAFEKGLLFLSLSIALTLGCPARVFLTGSNRWHSFDAWPPKQADRQALYFRGNGTLSFDRPQGPGPAHDEYLSDPAKPVP